MIYITMYKYEKTDAYEETSVFGSSDLIWF